MAIEHKKDEEIKRCLKVCSNKNSDCDSCTYRSPEKGESTCTDLLMRDALYLINKRERQIIDTMEEGTEKLMKVLEKISK